MWPKLRDKTPQDGAPNIMPHFITILNSWEHWFEMIAAKDTRENVFLVIPGASGPSIEDSSENNDFKFCAQRLQSHRQIIGSIKRGNNRVPTEGYDSFFKESGKITSERVDKTVSYTSL